jgi:predicted cupin superfamily sugar epimerase
MTARRDMTADGVIALLALAPHPEGGYYRETFRDQAPGRDQSGGRGQEGGRGHGTAIYYLLKAGERSHWHRVDAAEIWHWYAGGPLRLSLSEDGKATETHRLGPDLAAGERPQLIVPANAWQSAEPLGAWTLVGCTVTPAFVFEGFELAPKDWAPGGGTLG